MNFIALAFNMWFIKAVKFGLVGALGLVIDFSITYICKEKLRWNKFVSNSLGFSFAVVQNYFLNRSWTFNSVNQQAGLQFSKFLLVAILGLLLNNICLYIFLKYTNQKYFYICKVCVTGVVFIWNFLANSFYTFK